MKARFVVPAFLATLFIIAFFTFSSPFACAQGVLLRGIGSVNESMGGASIAAPLDSAGAIYTNPAAIAGLRDNEMSFGLGLIMPHSTVTSQINGMPQTRATAESEAGEIPCPTMSAVYRTSRKSPFTYGIAISGVGGAAALYPANGNFVGPIPVNPILRGEARTSNVQVFQVMPTVAFNMTDRLALGITPVVGLASLSVNPMPFGLDPATPMHNYGTKYTWGMGVNFGAYYDFQNDWRTGFSIKSPMWADPLEFTGTVGGAPTSLKHDLDLPMILGWGISYSGLQRTVLAMDIRYFDYENTNGFGEVIENGVVSGLGWKSIMSVAFGVQYTLNPRMKLRMGYCFNENPIPDENQYANVASPLFMQHVASIGATYTFANCFDIVCAWSHAFENEATGLFAAGGGLRGTVTNTVYADTLLFGLTKRF